MKTLLLKSMTMIVPMMFMGCDLLNTDELESTNTYKANTEDIVGSYRWSAEVTQNINSQNRDYYHFQLGEDTFGISLAIKGTAADAEKSGFTVEDGRIVLFKGFKTSSYGDINSELGLVNCFVPDPEAPRSFGFPDGTCVRYKFLNTGELTISYGVRLWKKEKSAQGSYTHPYGGQYRWKKPNGELAHALEIFEDYSVRVSDPDGQQNDFKLVDTKLREDDKEKMNDKRIQLIEEIQKQDLYRFDQDFAFFYREAGLLFEINTDESYYVILESME